MDKIKFIQINGEINKMINNVNYFNKFYSSISYISTISDVKVQFWPPAKYRLFPFLCIVVSVGKLYSHEGYI